MSQRSLRFVSFDLLTPSPLIGTVVDKSRHSEAVVEGRPLA